MILQTDTSSWFANLSVPLRQGDMNRNIHMTLEAGEKWLHLHFDCWEGAKVQVSITLVLIQYPKGRNVYLYLIFLGFMTVHSPFGMLFVVF